ncbi:MAG: type II toxin-antitoxin system HicB family antitoxin [Candidatus Caccovivens sp.]
MKNNILVYPAIFRKEENGYSVFIPDLENATCGQTLEEAIYMAKDLIGGLAVFYKENEKKELPKATNIKDIKLEQENDFVSLIEINYDEYKKSLIKSVKKTVYIPSDLNMEAEELGINFSQVLREALRVELNRQKKQA